MHNRSLSRELSLISLGLIKDKGDFKLNKFQIEEIFESALDSLINHCREELDNCESQCLALQFPGSGASHTTVDAKQGEPR